MRVKNSSKNVAETPQEHSVDQVWKPQKRNLHVRKLLGKIMKMNMFISFYYKIICAFTYFCCICTWTNWTKSIEHLPYPPMYKSHPWVRRIPPFALYFLTSRSHPPHQMVGPGPRHPWWGQIHHTNWWGQGRVTHNKIPTCENTTTTCTHVRRTQSFDALFECE